MLEQFIAQQQEVNENSLSIVESMVKTVKALESRVNLLEKTCDWQDKELNIYMEKMDQITSEVKEQENVK